MHVELTDLFRCPVAHRDSWLVLAADRTEARVVLDGVLGCPECHAEYPIRDGVALFAARTSAVGAHGDGSALSVDTDPEFPLRIAALLGVTDAASTIAMVGAPVSLACALQAVVPVRCIVVDAPDTAWAASLLLDAMAPLAVVQGDGMLPVAAGALHGVYAQRGEPAAYAAALRAGGRMVAPVDRRVPEGITELARDGLLWVGERAPHAGVAPGGLTELRRRR